MIISEVIKMLEELRAQIGDAHVYFSAEAKGPVPVDPKLRVDLPKLGVRRNGEITR